MAILDDSFIAQLVELGRPYPRFKWYISAIVALSSLNYPEEIGPLYTHILKNNISSEDHYDETRKIKEALVMAAGLHGAAKLCHLLRSISQIETDAQIDWNGNESFVSSDASSSD